MNHYVRVIFIWVMLFVGIMPDRGRAETYADQESYSLSLWVEAPGWDSKTGSAADYWTNLVSFITNHPTIKRVMIRLQDPVSDPVYYFPGASVGGNPVGKGTTLIDGLLLNQEFANTKAEVYVIPWLPDADAMSYPQPPSNLGVTESAWNALPNNIQKSAQWIALINQYVSGQSPTGVLVTGLVYESESAGEWSDKTKALPEFSSALTQFLSTGPVIYENTLQSGFVISSASQFDFDSGTDVILQKIFPQMYNLTKQVKESTTYYVDAAASGASGTNTFLPNFPDSLYTRCQSGGVGDATCMVSSSGNDLHGFMLLKGPSEGPFNDKQTTNDVNLMFSGEQAPGPVSTNPYYWHTATLAYPEPSATPNPLTGLINAFGTSYWKEWATMSRFFETLTETYFTQPATAGAFPNLALFQYNLLPITWNQSTDLSNYLGTRENTVDQDDFTFVAKRGQRLALSVRPVSGSGRAKVTVKGCGVKKGVTAELPISLSFKPSHAGVCKVAITNRSVKPAKRYSGRYIMTLKSGEVTTRTTQKGDSWASFIRVNPDH